MVKPQRIAFGLFNEDKNAVYWRAANGTGDDELLGSVPDQRTFPWAWSADGKILVTMDFINGSDFNIGSFSMDGEHLYKALLQGKYTEVQPIISPHGRWMAYMSNQSGKGEIYVRSFPDMEKAKSKVSTDGGNSPLWSPDEKELFYLNNNEVIRVPIEKDPAFKVGKPETLFHGDYVQLWTNDAHTWDISPDGKRFLMMKWGEAADENSTGHATPKINVVLNWFEELKERVPVE